MSNVGERRSRPRRHPETSPLAGQGKDFFFVPDSTGRGTLSRLVPAWNQVNQRKKEARIETYRAAVVFEQRVVARDKARKADGRDSRSPMKGEGQILAAAAVAAVKGSEQRRLLFDNPENTRNSWMRTSLRCFRDASCISTCPLLVKSLHICLVRRWSVLVN